MDETLREIIQKYFPTRLQQAIWESAKKVASKTHQLEEIRLRLTKPAMLVFPQEDVLVNHTVHKQDIQKLISLISENSVYSYQNDLNNGFITVAGGHRVGILGRTYIKKNEIRAIRDISSVNFRISREINGSASELVSRLFDKLRKPIKNTILVGPPACGKTTMLRDLTRIISSGNYNIPPHKVTVIDERSELSGVVKGVPQRDIGLRTDVLDGCPKSQGIILALRSMSPEVIVTDEIGSEQDIVAITEAMNAGVKIIASAHGNDINSLLYRQGVSLLVRTKSVERFVLLSRNKGPGTIEHIQKGTNNDIPKISVNY